MIKCVNWIVIFYDLRYNVIKFGEFVIIGIDIIFKVVNKNILDEYILCIRISLWDYCL